jgi:hypothetical protein
MFQDTPLRHTACLALWCALTALTACDGEVNKNAVDQDDPVVTDKQVVPGDPINPLDPAVNPTFEEGDECTSHEEFFEEQVFSDVMEHWCVGCHTSGGIAAGSRLVLEPVLPFDVSASTNDRSPEELEGIHARNFAAAKLVATDRSLGESMLLLKPTNLAEHVGGEMIQVGSEDYRKLATFVARVNGEASECAQPATYACDQENPWPGSARLRRLSHDEYNQTLSDLFGGDVRAADNFVADPEIHGYLNNARALRESTVLLEQWMGTAELLADQLVNDLPGSLPCDASQGESCARQFIETFGAQAFRRPMEAADTDRYIKLFKMTSAPLGFEEGIRDVVTAMLVSPHFLYRSEVGELNEETGQCELGAYEIASELSYLIWGTMPDQVLLDAAAAGELATPDEIKAQTRRMLKDERGERAFRRFVFKWLHLDRFDSVVRDAGAYPDFDNDIRERMLSEAEQFITDTYDEGRGNLRDLFSNRGRKMDVALATYYGLDVSMIPNDGATHEVLVDEDRAGILGLGAFLTTHASGDSSSPVKRGALVRERLLCQELPPPPPALDITLKFQDPNAPPPTTRERFEQHSEDASCVGCHRLIDPIGFTMESYNGVGQWRDIYEHNGAPINSRGAIINSKHSDGPLAGLGDLTQAVSGGADLAACFTEQRVQFGYGVGDRFEWGCSMEVIEDAFVQGDLSFEELIVSMTQTPHFTRRTPGNWSQDDWYSGEPPEPAEPTPIDPDPVDPVDPDPVDPDPVDPVDPVDPDPVVPDPMTPDVDTNDPNLQVTPTMTNDWGAGFCQEVDVINAGTAAITWRVTLQVDATISNHWEADIDKDSGAVSFTGKPYNAMIEPGQTAHFGFCANR